MTGETLDTTSCILSYDDDFVTHLKSRALKGAGWVMVGRLGGVVQGVFTLVLARLLAPQDFGLMGMAAVFVVFAGVFRSPGLHSALIQRRGLTEGQLSSVFWVTVAVGLLLTVSLVVASPFIAAFYKQPAVMPILALLSLDMLVRSSFQVPNALLHRKLRFQVFACLDIGASAASGSLAVWLVFLGAGVWALVGRALLHSALAAAVFWLLAGWRPSFHFRFREAWPFILFGLPLLGVTIVKCLHSQFALLLIGKMLGAASLGYYRMALALVMLPAMHLSQPLVSLALPVFSSLQHDRRRLARHYLMLLKAVAAGVFPAAIGLAILAPSIVAVVLGQKWLPALVPLQILCSVGILQALYATAPSVFRSQGRPGLEFAALVFSLLAIVGAYLVGLRWGIVGLCAAHGVCMCFVTPLVIRKAAGLLGIGLGEVLRSVWAPVAGALLMGTVLQAFRALHGTGIVRFSEGVFLAVAVLLGAGVYVAAMSLLAARDLVPLAGQAVGAFFNRTVVDTAAD